MYVRFMGLLLRSGLLHRAFRRDKFRVRPEASAYTPT